MTEECGNPANIRYTWPGQDEVTVCIECADKAQRIAQAMGLHLQMIPFHYYDNINVNNEEDFLDWPTCKVNVPSKSKM
jgi:hypothetical protein